MLVNTRDKAQPHRKEEPRANGKDNRTIRIELRVTPDEYKVIKTNTEKSGLSVSEFIRSTVLGKTIVTAPPADFIFLIREVKRVGSNLNQLLHKLNALGIAHSTELNDCENEIRETVKMLYRTFRPKDGVH